MANGSEDGPQYLSLNEISRHLLRTMRSRSLPTPQTHGTNTTHGLFLVRNAAWSPNNRPS